MVPSKESGDKENKNKPPEKPYFSPNLAWALGLAIFGFNFFAYKTTLGIGFGLFQALLVASLFLVLKKNKHHLFALFLALIGITANLFVGFRANGFVQAVNIITGLVCFLLLFIIHTYPSVSWKTWWLFKKIRTLITKVFKNFSQLIRYINKSGDKNKNKIPRVLKTVIITVIILLFFSAILSAADPIFSQIIAQIRAEIIGRTIFSLILSLILLVFFTLQLTDKQEEVPRLKFLSFSDIFIPILSLVTLFGFFLGIQAKYLFASHEIFKSFNLTYSEYVRKGFFELMAATFFAGLISYLLILKRNAEEQKSKKSKLKLINLFLVVELFLLLASALKRDIMYIQTYGLTRTRIIGEVFLAWLSISLFCLLILNLWSKFKEKHFLAGLGIISLAAVVFFNSFNMDQHIVKSIPLRHQQKTDLFYISILSEDAFQGWKEAIPQAQQIFNDLKSQKITEEEKSQLANIKLAMISLQQKRDRLIEKYDPNKELAKKFQKQRKWQSTNWSEYQAYLGIWENHSLFYDTLNQLLEEIKKYQEDHNTDLYEQEYWILNEFRYPFIEMRIDYHPQIFPQPNQPIGV